MTYSGGLGGAAAVAWSGANGAKTLVLGFPFETITTSGARAAIMRRTLDSFGFTTVVPTRDVSPELPFSNTDLVKPAVTRSTLRNSVAADVLA